MKNKIIYVVNSGSYSDYRVDGLFETKELAEEYMKSYPKSYDDYNSIKEYELNPESVKIQEGLFKYTGWMKKNGDSKYIARDPDSDEGFIISRGKDNFRFCVYAQNENHAVKIANEKRVQMIANNELI